MSLFFRSNRITRGAAAGRRRASTWAATFLLATALAGHAAAKDVCLTDGSSHYVFKKVKALKPGGAVPLTGYIVFKNNFDVFPLEGTAMMKSDGTVVAAIACLELGGPGYSTIIKWNADTTFAGDGLYDVAPFDSADGGTTFTTVDCHTVTVP